MSIVYELFYEKESGYESVERSIYFLSDNNEQELNFYFNHIKTIPFIHGIDNFNRVKKADNINITNINKIVDKSIIDLFINDYKRQFLNSAIDKLIKLNKYTIELEENNENLDLQTVLNKIEMLCKNIIIDINVRL